MLQPVRFIADRGMTLHRSQLEMVFEHGVHGNYWSVTGSDCCYRLQVFEEGRRSSR